MPGKEARGRMLGIDVGTRRIGLAVSDGALAVPLTIIEHKNRAADLDRILAIAGDEQASRIIVGLPLRMSGEDSEQTRLTRKFASDLERRASVPVVLHDERLSTAQVASAPGQRRVRPGRPKPRVDDLAAAVILQSYIDAHQDAP